MTENRKINAVFIVINAPSLLIAPLPLLYLCKVHISGFYIPLNSQNLCDSEKWCVLVLPKRILLTRNKENKNKTWQFWSQTHWNLQKYEIKLHNFFRFKVCFKYFKLSRHYTCQQARTRQQVSIIAHCHWSRDMILFICNSRPPFWKMHRPGAFITINMVYRMPP